MYHCDGPGAIAHHDHLLSIPRLSMLQWTPGAGVEPVYHPRWWPLYHKTVEAGKKVFVGGASVESLLDMKREFGDDLKQFLIAMQVASPEQAAEVMRIAEV